MSAAALHRLGGEGPDILFIHGFGADRLSWLALAPKLFPFGTVWAVEYAGHGMAGNDVGEGNPSDLSRAIAARASVAKASTSRPGNVEMREKPSRTSCCCARPSGS